MYTSSRPNLVPSSATKLNQTKERQMLQHRINLAFAAMCHSYKVQHTALPVDEQQYHAFAAVKRKLLDRLGDAGLVGYGFEQVWTKSI
jgi:hypothetical protein